MAVFTKHNVDNDDDDVTTKEKEADITEPLKYWRTTAGGLRIVDDKVDPSGEKPVNGDVVRVQCEAKLESNPVFVEPPPDGITVSKDDRGVTLVCAYDDEASSVWLQESLQGMRVGGRRRVLIPSPTSSSTGGVSIRFVGLGTSEAVENDNGVICLDLTLKAVEPTSSTNAVLARALASGGITAALALWVRPLLSPQGLIVLLLFTPLLIKKFGNAMAMLELYVDVDAQNPLQLLLDWKLKF